MDSTASPMTKYLIIGNSVAANAAAARLHSLDPHGVITLVTDEPEPYYSRCALMYYAMDHCHKRDTYLADPVHYRRLNARLVHAKATAVDTQTQLVGLEDGGELSYDRLLIASGSVGRRLDVPGESCAGLHEFITLTDATAVVESSRGARRALVVGGGLIGAEAAEVFHVLGLETAYLVREPHFYARFCSPEQGEIVRRHFEEQGLALLTERTSAAGVPGYTARPATGTRTAHPGALPWQTPPRAGDSRRKRPAICRPARADAAATEAVTDTTGCPQRRGPTRGGAWGRSSRWRPTAPR